MVKNGEAWKEIQIEKKVSNGFMFVMYLFFNFFPSVLDPFPICAILGQFLSQLGQYMSCFHLSLAIHDLVSSSISDPHLIR